MVKRLDGLSSIIDNATASLGYSKIKDEQKKALHTFMSRKDVFVSLPMLYGKSLCYALLPSIIDMKRSLVEKHISCNGSCHRL